SIRIPASCCGVFGLKPTRGRNPLGPDIGDVMSGLAVEHALTLSVRDSAALLDATCGPDPGAPYWAVPPQRPFLQEVATPPGKLRIVLTIVTIAGNQVHRDCLLAVQDAAQLCADLGHEVDEATPPWSGRMVEAFLTLWASGCATTLERAALFTGRKVTEDQVEPLTWALAQHGRRFTAPDYLLAVQTLQYMSRQLARFLAGYDVWLTPTLAEPPVPLGTFDPPPANPLQSLDRAVEFTPFTGIANATGQPAMSVPLYWNAQGLPIGVHFMGRYGDEATLFRLAAQLEQARPWAQRRPPQSA
ncbi:MAG: amidase, partial [Acidobacteria bacterium]|nr:amidase [Acidobacteriota bacterium]